MALFKISSFNRMQVLVMQQILNANKWHHNKNLQKQRQKSLFGLKGFLIVLVHLVTLNNNRSIQINNNLKILLVLVDRVNQNADNLHHLKKFKSVLVVLDSQVILIGSSLHQNNFSLKSQQELDNQVTSNVNNQYRRNNFKTKSLVMVNQVNLIGKILHHNNQN